MASPEPADYTFTAIDYDANAGSRACRKLADAFAGGRDPRAEEIREAMAAATSAFPGLQDFVTDMGDRDLDPEDAMLDVSRVSAEHQGPMLAAAAKLALIGAMAEAAESFDWHDVVDCARFCQEAFAQSAANAT
jgi:hypothetical protein